jgi:hypothetical protein
MKKLLFVMLATLVLLLAGCGGEQATSVPAATPTTIPAPTATVASGPDFSDPASVAQAIFDAAASADFAALAGLCDPQKQNDRDTQSICDLATDTTNQADFLAVFAKGKVSGAAALRTESGLEYADVPILMGESGTDEETITLVNRDGKWYLSSF